MIYWIRHAESQYNLQEEKIFKKHGAHYFQTQQYLNLKFNPELQDTSITQQGYKQCLRPQEIMSKIDVNLVIVSPLRRAMITCHQIFKDHKDKPLIIVDPDFREILESGCDIGSLLHLSLLEFPYFDYSLIKDKEAWYIHTIKHLPYRDSIVQKLGSEQGEQRRKTAISQTLLLLKKVWQERTKSNQKQALEIKQRMLACTNIQKYKLRELAKKYKNIAVVSHSENIKCYAGYKIKNCEVYQYPPNKLSINQIDTK